MANKKDLKLRSAKPPSQRASGDAGGQTEHRHPGSSSTRAVSEKKKLRSKCLVLYPTRLESYYSKIYRPAIRKANLEPVTLSKIITIHSRIRNIQEIIDSVEFVLADISGRDKDVLFRAGLAEGAGKPVGIITQNPRDIPSDIQHVGNEIYETKSTNWFDALQQAITNMIQSVCGVGK